MSPLWRLKATTLVRAVEWNVLHRMTHHSPSSSISVDRTDMARRSSGVHPQVADEPLPAIFELAAQLADPRRRQLELPTQV
jgi:hypothetical protein